MFDYSVSNINSDYSFRVNGVSSMVNPKDNTIMFLTPKNLDEAVGIEKCSNCLIFVPREYEIKSELQNKHCIIAVDNPRLEYVQLVNSILDKTEKVDQEFELINGSYISKQAKIGANVRIAPLCVVERDVEIGDNTIIKSGTKIGERTILGERCVINENCVIATGPINIIKDEQMHNIQMPLLGSVAIGDEVGIGAICRIERGVIDETIIESRTKISHYSSIGHESHVGKDCIIIQAIIAGHVFVGENVYFGLNTTVKQRLFIGNNAFIGMGAVVMRDVPEGMAVAGNPARQIKR